MPWLAGNTLPSGGGRPFYLDDGAVDISRSQCFAVALTPENAPWAFCRGEPFRVVSFLELMATIVALMAFAPPAPEEQLRTTFVNVTSHTDSAVATAVLGRGATTSFPLCLLAMEAAAQMEALGLDLHLQWVPRESNGEADALSNLRFEGFDAKQRIEIDISALPLKVLPGLLKDATDFYAVPRAAVPQRRRRGKRKRLRDTEPW